MRATARARRRSASTSRSFGAAVVTRSSSRCCVMCAISCTARSKAASFAFDGLFMPLTLRTYCSAAECTSSELAGGSKLWRTRMFRHMPRCYVTVAAAPAALVCRAVRATLRLDPKLLAIALGAIIPLSIAGIATYGVAGEVRYWQALGLAAGSIVGARIGAGLLARIDERLLKIVFGTFLLAVAVLLGARG